METFNALRKRIPGSAIIMTGLVIFALTLLYAMVIRLVQPPDSDIMIQGQSIRYVAMGIFVMILSMSVYLAYRMGQTSRSLEKMIVSVAEKERLEEQLKIAREIQLHMLPASLPQTADLDLAGDSVPALEVAGDYYDASILLDGKIAIAIGDVMGKGVGPAMLMSNLQSSLKVLLQEPYRQLDKIVANLNNLIYENSAPEMFITFFIGVYDPYTGELEYVNAGHDAPLLIRRNGISTLFDGGLLLGALNDMEYDVGRERLVPGDIIIAYTDGITEAMNTLEMEFGVDNLINDTRKMREDSAKIIVETVLNNVKVFMGGASDPWDDLTILAMKVLSLRE